MQDLSQVLKKGTLLVIETGEYSDRNWFGPVRLLKDTTKAKLVEAYKKEWVKEPDSWRDAPDPDGFLPWLVKSKRAEDVANVHSWHVGSYGEFDPVTGG